VIACVPRGASAISLGRGLLRFAETLMVGSICSFGCSAADGHGGETGTIGAASAGAGDWAGHCYDNPGINTRATPIDTAPSTLHAPFART